MSWFRRANNRPTIYLDIDGVLNRHVAYPNRYCGTKWDLVQRLNCVLADTDAQIVLTSAWRYLVLSGQMTRSGLESLFLTHGLDCKGRMHGMTRRDTMVNHGSETRPLPNERGQQIVDYMRRNRMTGHHVVIDDLDLGISAKNLNFIQTLPDTGLTAYQAKVACLHLRGHDGLQLRGTFP